MPHISDNAIVLRRLDYSESSLVVVVMGQTCGKIRVIAKGTRRSTRREFKPGIDLLEAGSIVVSVREHRQEALAILVEWKQKCAFIGIREKLDRLIAAQYIADVAARMTEDWDPHPSVYESLHQSLEALASARDVFPPIVRFQRALLKEAGLMPELNHCVGCEKPITGSSEIYLSSFEGGLLCRDCEGVHVEKRLVTVAPEALTTHDVLDAHGPDVASGMFDLFNYHLTHLMKREPAAMYQLQRLAQGIQHQ